MEAAGFQSSRPKYCYQRTCVEHVPLIGYGIGYLDYTYNLVCVRL